MMLSLLRRCQLQQRGAIQVPRSSQHTRNVGFIPTTTDLQPTTLSLRDKPSLWRALWPEPQSPRVTPVEFEELSRNGRATIHHAVSCLTHLRKDLEPLPIQSQREECRRLSIGGRVLLWLWDLGTVDKPMRRPENLTAAQILQWSLGWFLVGEGQDSYVFRWYEAVAQIGMSRNRSAAFGAYFAGIAAACCEWSEEGSPNSALECALQCMRCGSELKPQHAFGLCYQTSHVLDSILLREECPPAQGDLFDQYNDLRKKHIATLAFKPRDYKVDILSALPLYHPANPNADPFLDMARTAWSGAVEHELGAFRSRNRWALRAAHIFRLQGRDEDADWLDSFLEKDASLSLEYCQVLHNSLLLDPKLEGLRAGNGQTAPGATVNR